ncbi:MAG: hypothetical protein M9952_10980 [Microthrixaceae bacterium]|nr:hypothetical protein [Microthrixaceae bacterium]
MSLDTSELIPTLGAHLREWLPSQAWFDARLNEIDELTVVRTEALRRSWPIVLWVPVEVVIDAAPSLVHMFVALAASVPASVPDRGVIGEVPTGGTPLMAYDALLDPVAARAVVERLSDTMTDEVPTRIFERPWVTNIELGSRFDLTLYRRVQLGKHPDVDLAGALAAAGLSVTCPPAAVWRRGDTDLANLRRRSKRGDLGVSIAQASARELLRRRCQPRENPLDVMDSFALLGRNLADMHVELAEQYGVTVGDGEALLDVLVERLPRQLSDEAADVLEHSLSRLVYADDLGGFIRVHNNLDLSNVERIRSGWLVHRFGCRAQSDLELESRPLSPLVDLAGLLHGCSTVARSAAADALAAINPDEQPEPGTPAALELEADRREVRVLADAWEERAADALIAGYTSNDAVHRLLPVERIARDALLTLFELELSIRDLVVSTLRGHQLVSLPLESVDGLIDTPIRLRW